MADEREIRQPGEVHVRARETVTQGIGEIWDKKTCILHFHNTLKGLREVR